jgi:uncharacterized repeat protein (TIGR03803 family)
VLFSKARPRLCKRIEVFRKWIRRPEVCAAVLLALGASIASPADTYAVLQNFGSDTGLIQGFGGHLFGAGNALGPEGPYGHGGSIFRMSPTGAASTVYTFCSQPNCADGQDVAGIVLGADGNIYGATREGGANSSIDCSGEQVQTCGTIFKLTPSGTLTTLYSFCSQSNCADGSLPASNLIQGFDGNFYGMTSFGGTGFVCGNNGFQPVGCGTIFKITPQGALTTLYSFCTNSCVDGWVPSGNLVQGWNGNFYGTTNSGGTVSAGPPWCGSSPCGNIFEITPQGALTSLYNFCSLSNCADGVGPTGLVLANNGVFYGTTAGGGANNQGTVFAFTRSNVLTTLYSFCAQANCPDGESPGLAGGPLIQASDGNLYGETFAGGANNGGTLFNITPAGALTTLYNFCAQTDCFDGISPNTSLFQYTDGVLYGAAGGGNPGNGVVYSLTAGLRRFVTTLPTLGKAGRKVTILGNNLTGATAVTFNGTSTEFTVVSSTEITTTVPAGATSGRVKVTTPIGTHSTVAPFLVP